MQKLFTRNLQFLGKASHFTKMQLKSLKNPSYFLNALDLGPKDNFSLYHPTHYYFSTNSDNPNKNDSTSNSGIPPKYRPQTIPLREFKNLMVDETTHEIRRYVLFTSANPIFPNNKIRATINTGNLNLNQFESEILYVLTHEGNPEEIYTVGVVLNSDINQQLERNKGGDKAAFDSITSPKKVVITPKKQHFRVKITEIEMTKEGNFVKGYVIKDDELTEEEKLINLKNEVAEMRHVCNSIKNIMQENVFNINFDIYERNDLDVEKLDELLFLLLNQIWNMNNLTKENLPEFAQSFLEQTNVIVRLFMVKKKLNEMFRVAIMVAKSLKYAEDSIRKRNEQAKAQLSIQYLESTYLSSQQQAKQAQQGFDTSAQNPTAAKLKAYREKLALIKDESSREKVKKEIERVSQMDKHSTEYSKILTYLEEVFNVPWEKYSEEVWDVDYTKKVLEEGLYGLEKVKERIVELVATNKLRDLNEKNPKKGIVICLYGPPGTGKTSIAKHLAKSLNREMRMISFAGVTDMHFIKGHRRTYVDSQPGVFVRELIKAKTMNPVFVLDEIDKMGRHGQGADPYYALLEILNHEENHNFVDHYLDIKVDFSRVIFVLTANQTLNMLEPLRNRLEIIEVPAYIDKEKLTISKDYLLPKVLEAHGLLPESIKFDDETILKIIKGWCYYESGVRELKRCYEKIARKFAHDLVDELIKKQVKSAISAGESTQINNSDSWLDSKINDWEGENSAQKDKVINLELKVETPEEATKDQKAEEVVEDSKLQTVQPVPSQPDKEDITNILEARSAARLKFAHDDKDIQEKLQEYLGLPIFDEVYERISRKSYIGVCNVLTVSGFSGHVLSVEVIHDITNPEKKNNYTLTGNLKQVLQESLAVAKINALNCLPKDKFEEAVTNNYHIHFLQGSSPKDGPSAGISVCTALLSRMLGKPVSSQIAMTGELSLNGDIYKIGGIQSKLTAAKALDIKTILIPHGNKAEFLELPDALKEGLTVYFVKKYKEVYDIVFSEDAEAIEKIDHFDGTKMVSKNVEQISPAVEKGEKQIKC